MAVVACFEKVEKYKFLPFTEDIGDGSFDQNLDTSYGDGGPADPDWQLPGVKREKSLENKLRWVNRCLQIVWCLLCASYFACCSYGQLDLRKEIEINSIFCIKVLEVMWLFFS